LDINIISKSVPLLVFLFFSAFFSSAETAFTAIGRAKLKTLVEQNSKSSKQLQKLLKHPHKLLTAILIGNNIANVGASAIATILMMELLEKTSMNTFATSLSIVTGIITLVLLVFGEITPKTIAIKNPSKLALKMTPFLYLYFIAFTPIIQFFSMLSVIISKLLGMGNKGVKQLLTEEEVRAIIKLAEEEGIIETQEKDMIDGVLKISEKVVREIMTPRIDTVCIPSNTTIKDAIQIITTKGHSRIPIYEDNIDNIQGIIYAKDLINIPEENQNQNVQKFGRKPLFCPESKSIETLLQQMKVNKFHMSIVVDEYGGMAGIVTFEDIIEEIVGEVQDEHDIEENAFTEVSSNHFIVDAKMNIHDLSDKIGLQIEDDDDDYDTVGGFVIHKLGYFPQKGQALSLKNFTVKVREIRKRRIISVDFHKTSPPS
jgi:putative hemolysin